MSVDGSQVNFWSVTTLFEYSVFATLATGRTRQNTAEAVTSQSCRRQQVNGLVKTVEKRLESEELRVCSPTRTGTRLSPLAQGLKTAEFIPASGRKNNLECITGNYQHDRSMLPFQVDLWN